MQDNKNINEIWKKLEILEKGNFCQKVMFWKNVKNLWLDNENCNTILKKW